MKDEVSPRVVVVAVLVTLAVILGLYWRGLLTEPGKSGKMKGGGGSIPPPPPAGLPSIEVTTVAGRPAPGSADGPGRDARFNGPSGVAAAPDGTVFVSDSRNHRIRAIAPGGEVRTFAGIGPTDTLEGGYEDGPAARARFWNPAGLARGSDGTLYVADTGNHCIRRIRPDGQVSTVVGVPGPKDAAGRPTGGYADGPSASARFSSPTAVAVAPSGDLFVADTGNHCIRKVGSDGRVSTLAGRPGPGLVDGVGPNARFWSPVGLALAADGTLYVADAGNRCLRAVSPTGATRTVPTPRLEPPPPDAEWTAPPEPMGPGVAPAGLRLLQPAGVAVDGGGRLCVTDVAVHCLYQVEPTTGALTLLAGTHDETGLAFWADGNGVGAHFARPAALAAGPGGVLFVADFGNNCVRRVFMRPSFTAPGGFEGTGRRPPHRPPWEFGKELRDREERR